jgi:serine protease Do
VTQSWLAELADSAAAVAGRARASLVTVDQHGRGVGSGILWSPGWVVTNAHVARTSQLSVRWGDGPAVTARLRAHNSRLDLAALEFEGDAGQPAVIGDSTALRTGEWVFAVGNPWGVAGGVTGGAVIDPAAGPDGAWLALGLHLRPGHSGGAVVNARGEVVGVNAMMNGPDVGLAISSDTVKRFLRKAGLTKNISHLDQAA